MATRKHARKHDRGFSITVPCSGHNIHQHLLFDQHGFTCASQFVEECARQLTEDNASSISVLFELLIDYVCCL
jgi:hypothetical protein